MAKIRVTRSQAIACLQKEMVLDDRYTFKAISDILKKNFDGINSSQISGLIHRLSESKGYLEKYRTHEFESYWYEVNTEWNNVDDLISNKTIYELTDIDDLYEKIIKNTINELNELKKNIDDEKVFTHLTNKIKALENTIKEKEND